MRRRKFARAGAALLAGAALALASTFAPPRDLLEPFADIAGCETGCRVAAAGWPLPFVIDYPGMSVFGRVDITEVWFAADHFRWWSFLADWLLWSVLAWSAARLLWRRRRRRRRHGRNAGGGSNGATTSDR